MSSGTQLVAAAAAEVGYRETPRNRTKFGKAMGMDALPWCATFIVYLLIRFCGIDLRRYSRNPYYTPTLYADMKARGWKVPNKLDARPGDIVFFDFPDKVFRIQHVGICTGSTSSSVFTIDGNTSDRSAFNGGAVLRRTRPWSTVVGVCRPPYSEAPAATPAPWTPPKATVPRPPAPPEPEPPKRRKNPMQIIRHPNGAMAKITATEFVVYNIHDAEKLGGHPSKIERDTFMSGAPVYECKDDADWNVWFRGGMTDGTIRADMVSTWRRDHPVA